MAGQVAGARIARAVMVLAAAVAPACGGSSGPAAVPSPSPTPGLSRLSGDWSGTLTVTPTGSCPAPAASHVTMLWAVTDQGDVAIQEGGTAAWFGSVNPALQVDLSKLGNVLCGQNARAVTARYVGTIRQEGSTYRLDTQSNETWCTEECTYRLAYTLSRP